MTTTISSMEDISPKTIPLQRSEFPRRRVRAGLFLTLAGFIIFLIGARPSLFGMDRSPVVGFVQIAVFLIGLAMICIGGYLSLAALWNSETRSIAADFGLRLVSTGFVVCVFAGMADVFGFGSHTAPKQPYFGPWQAGGVEIGQVIIALGFLMMIPYHRRRQAKKQETDSA